MNTEDCGSLWESVGIGQQRRLELPVDRIDVWHAGEDAIADSPSPRCETLLTPEERARRARFVRARDGHRFLLARALVRTVLSLYADVRPERWRFSTNAYGKPRIEATEGGASELEFNIAHTDGLVAVAVARTRSVGIDVEQCRLRPAMLDIASHSFSSAEARALEELPEHERGHAFLTLWTLKEAYVKAVGLGLSIPLASFSIDAPRGADGSRTRPAAVSQPGWRLWTVTPSANHLMGVCAECRDSESLRLTVSDAAPLLA